MNAISQWLSERRWKVNKQAVQDFRVACCAGRLNNDDASVWRAKS